MDLMSFSSFPAELIESILAVSIPTDSTPAHVLCVNSTFYAIGSRLLYTKLRFRTIRQLAWFTKLSSPVPYLPREISVCLAGGTVDFSTFRYLKDVFRRCLRPKSCDILDLDLSPFATGHNTATLPLDMLYLRLNSHASNPGLHHIYDCLALAK